MREDRGSSPLASPRAVSVDGPRRGSLRHRRPESDRRTSHHYGARRQQEYPKGEGVNSITPRSLPGGCRVFHCQRPGGQDRQTIGLRQHHFDVTRLEWRANRVLFGSKPRDWDRRKRHGDDRRDQRTLSVDPASFRPTPRSVQHVFASCTIATLMPATRTPQGLYPSNGSPGTVIHNTATISATQTTRS